MDGSKYEKMSKIGEIPPPKVATFVVEKCIPVSCTSRYFGVILYQLELCRMYISRNDFSILNRLSRYLSGVCEWYCVLSDPVVISENIKKIKKE